MFRKRKSALLFSQNHWIIEGKAYIVEERDLCKFTCVGGSIEKHHQQNIGIPQAIVACQQST